MSMFLWVHVKPIWTVDNAVICVGTVQIIWQSQRLNEDVGFYFRCCSLLFKLSKDRQVKWTETSKYPVGVNNAIQYALATCQACPLAQRVKLWPVPRNIKRG